MTKGEEIGRSGSKGRGIFPRWFQGERHKGKKFVLVSNDKTISTCMRVENMYREARRAGARRLSHTNEGEEYIHLSARSQGKKNVGVVQTRKK